MDTNMDVDMVMGLGHANGHMDKHITAIRIPFCPLSANHNIVKSSKGVE